MPRLKTAKRNLRSPGSRIKTSTTRDKRLTGRKLQDIRFRKWSENPHCAECGEITAWPYGFEIDHIIPLEQGGPDTDDNRQLLCVTRPDKIGCHELKTNQERKGKDEGYRKG